MPAPIDEPATAIAAPSSAAELAGAVAAAVAAGRRPGARHGGRAGGGARRPGGERDDEQHQGAGHEHAADPGEDEHPGPAAPRHGAREQRRHGDQRQSGYPGNVHVLFSSALGSAAEPVATGTCHGRNGRPCVTKTRENSS